jgi:hypothetical protein
VSGRARPPGCDTAHLPLVLSWRIWAGGIVCFLLCYGTMWSYVHAYADLHPCIAHLPDPLFALVSYQPWFFQVTGPFYKCLTVFLTLVLLGQAILGDHVPLVRWGVALSVQALLRSVTILLIPLCRVTVPVGTCAATSIRTYDIGPLHVPWHLSALNDLMFSGHVGEFILLMLATRSWPRPVRAALWTWQIVQAYGLIATRGHYTADIVVAIPFALLADRVAMAVLGRLSPARA